jgi:Legionella pneumophila major outer membrane protein precursor
MNPQNENLATPSTPARSGCQGRLPRKVFSRRGWIRVALPAGVLAVLVVQSGRAWGQLPGSLLVPAPAPPASVPTNSTGNEAPYLTGLPNAPDLPSSLYAPATPTYTCSVPECPYFDCDPRLDPFCLPQPGWLADVEVDVNQPHVSNGIHDTVTLGGITSQVKLGSARLDWTGSPRVELGYRLPDGFGEFDISYRFLGARGTGTVEGPGAAPDGPASLVSRLDIQVADLQYASNEISICTWWMKWHLGLRGTDVFFDSRADEDPAVAAGGSGVFERRMTNSFWGIGPSWALDLERRIGDSGFTVVGRLDGAIFLGRLEQGFFEVATTGASAQTIRSNPEPVPTVDWSIGIAWRPPSCQALRCFIGYQGEGWWDVGSFEGAGSGSGAQIYTEGVLFRVDYNY